MICSILSWTFNASLLEHIPNLNPSSASLLVKDPTMLPPTEVEVANSALQLAVESSHQVDQLIQPLGITTLDDTADPVVVTQQGRLLFEVPQRLYRRMQRLNETIVGESYPPIIFVRAVNSGIWWEHRQSPVDGGAEDFTFRGAALDVVQTYEEGVQVAKEKTSKMFL